MTRNTIQRAIILETVRKMHSHPTAEEVYAAVVANHPNISRATVYRNLKQLSEAGMISRIETPGSADHFDGDPPDHYHVRCTQCRKLFDVEMDYMPNLEQSIRDPRGFRFNGYDLVFRGTCPQCQSGAEESDQAESGTTT